MEVLASLTTTIPTAFVIHRRVIASGLSSHVAHGLETTSETDFTFSTLDVYELSSPGKIDQEVGLD